MFPAGTDTTYRQGIHKRNDVADIMKGIGILSIIVGHLTDFWRGALFSFHVPLFFMIAGYFFKEKPTRKSMEDDSIRLGIPYLLTCSVIVIFTLLYSIYTHFPIDTSWIVASLWGSGSKSSVLFGSIKPIGAIWFLLALFWSKQVFLQITKCPLWLSGALCISISILATFLGNRIIALPLSILPGLSALVFLFLGFWVRKFKDNNISKRYLAIPIVLAFSWLVYYSLNSNTIRLSIVTCFYKNYPIDIVLAIGGTAFVWLLSKLISILPIVKKAFCWIGMNSMTFLCLHLLDLDLGIRFFFQRFFSTTFATTDIYAIVFDILFCILGTIALSIFPFTQRVFGIRRLD